MDLAPLEWEKLHGFYLATRELLASDACGRTAIVRGDDGRLPP